VSFVAHFCRRFSGSKLVDIHDFLMMSFSTSFSIELALSAVVGLSGHIARSRGEVQDEEDACVLLGVPKDPRRGHPGYVTVVWSSDGRTKHTGLSSGRFSSQ
jgi:hypothetical protein